ncbi:MAG: mitochondrial 54S ribosomal protein mrpl1 [Phylliscum demangeonii]|nr:MAG: mitochondrial 54S ribosomal protein mrpl1 [Phylliscum demangeonii]
MTPAGNKLAAPCCKLLAHPLCRPRPPLPPWSPTFALSQTRPASQRPTGKAAARKKRARSDFRQYSLKDADQFALVDAMRYIRAFEVGRPPTSAKYELHVKLRTQKSGPVIRNRLRLPHPVKTDLRICVICPADSKVAQEATRAGATLVGEEEIFEAVRAGRIDFDRCLCHVDSLPRLNKSGIARILGPRRLMPSTKFSTVVRDVGASVQDMVGGAEYREKLGVVRMAVGQLGFSPEQMQKNIKAFMASMKKDMYLLSEKAAKEIHEVVLSSTHAPGFSLNGDFKSVNSVSLTEMGA